MKLSKEQIDQLFVFTRQHYVEYFDLQSELVDHLANAIETEWQENPKLTFNEVLNKEFKKFGVFGFMEIVEKRHSALNKKYNKMVWQELKSFFSVPKIITTLSLMGIVFYLLKTYHDTLEIMQGVFLGLVFVFIIGLFFIYRKNKINNQKTKKRWLLKDIIFGYSSMTGAINIPVQLALHLHGKQYQNWSLAIFSLLLAVLCLMIYIILILIPSKATEYLKKTYPEYELEN